MEAVPEDQASSEGGSFGDTERNAATATHYATWCKRVLTRKWYRVVAPAITLIYLGLATQATYVKFDVDSLYPTFLVLATACGASMYHNYFIDMIERWGVSWKPRAMQEKSEGRLLFLSLSAATLVCLTAVGILCQRAVRCK